MQSESLLVPLILKDKDDVSVFIEQACSASSPTKLLSWGLDGEGPETDCSVSGAALGCEDGSVYLFFADVAHKGAAATEIADLSPRKHAAPLRVALATQAPSVRSASPSPSPSPSLKSQPCSRSTSYSVHASHPFSQPTRSRVTSSVSKESAEAPRNHVDFDHEKEKLEEMLRGSPPTKEKYLVDGPRSSHGVSGLAKDDPKSSVRSFSENTTPSMPGTPRNYSSCPPSPLSVSFVPTPSQPPPNADSGLAQHIGLAPSLALRSHVIPPRCGAGRPVVSLRRLSTDTLLSLQESGLVMVISILSGLCLASLELESAPHLHPPPLSTLMCTSTTPDHSIWMWKYLHIAETYESTVLLAAASDQASVDNDGDVESRTRVAVLQLQKQKPLVLSLDSGTKARYGVIRKVGEWIMPGAPETIGLLTKDGASTPEIFYVTPGPSPKIVTHSLQVVTLTIMAATTSMQPSSDLPLATAPVSANPTSTSLPNISLSIPNPFKPRNSGLVESEAPEKEAISIPGKVVVGPAISLGQVPALEGSGCMKGFHIWSTGDQETRGFLWNDNNFVLFEARDMKNSPCILASMLHRDVVFVERLGQDIFVLFQKAKVDAYRVLSSQGLSTPSLEHMSSRKFSKPSHAVTIISPILLLCSRPKSQSDGTTCHRLEYVSVPHSSNARMEQRPRNEPKAHSAWSLSTKKRHARNDRRVTSLLPLEIDLIILGYNDGSIGRSSLSDLLTMGWPAPCEQNAAIDGIITSLHSIKSEHGNFIAGGVDNGGIAVWDLSTLQLRARWTIFTAPLRTVISLEDEIVGRLRSCVLCVSEDGTVAVIAMNGLEFLYLIPGSSAQLTRICLGEDNLLLVYADGKARLWDVRTQVFWRSMTTKTASDLLRQGNWFEVDIVGENRETNTSSLGSLQKCFSSYDAGSTLLLDIRALNDLIHPLPASHFFRDPRREDTGYRPRDQASAETSKSSKRDSRQLTFLKALLGSLLSFGLDNTIDDICREKLGILHSQAAIGLFSNDSSAAMLTTANAREVWQTSTEHTASRLLVLVTVLRGLLVFDECEQYASQVIAFYVASLCDTVGPLWKAPSLSFLARYWFHSASEVRLASRALFGAALDRLSDEDTISLVEYWQHELPCLQPDAEKQSAYSALALLITGNIATERYTVFSASTLTDIAKSMALYLHDETCPHRTLAIDICSRGFQIWQHYVDAMEVLRALFALSTSAEKERNVGPQARLAVLQIASSNTPLFMTTLSLDILRPRSVQQRNSIMQLVAFLIRKKPLVLYPNLPRLVEAVVKSLDPSSSGDRDVVFDAATDILGQVVKKFPSVDFHMQSQRLCVGTSEGAVIMYDLKTATRLYVLEGHAKRLGACSFSPDGRRLVTVSLEESLVRVWKVGSSFTNLFMPGAPPRQGHSGSEPFKTLNFNMGDESHMTVASTLELVQFEWPADRTARLKIRNNAFTFNT